MGIQIFIKTDELVVKGLIKEFVFKKELLRCDNCGDEYCDGCFGYQYATRVAYALIPDLIFPGKPADYGSMNVTRDGDFCWLDANEWGENREPLLAFIERHNLNYSEC